MSTPLQRLRERLARKAATRRGESVEPVVPSAATPESVAEPATAAAAAASTPTVGRAEEPTAAAVPRVVARIAWAYAAGELPGPWLMGCQRLKAVLKRAGHEAIRVEMTPLTSLPEGVDLVYVPHALVEAAVQAAPAALVIGLDDRPEAASLDELVTALRVGEALAPPPPQEIDPAEAVPRGRVVRYRGWERLD